MNQAISGTNHGLRRAWNRCADRLDGLDSTAFLRATGTAANAAALGGLTPGAFALSSGQVALIWGGAAAPFDWNQDLTDDSALVAAACPAGSTLVSGGFEQDGAVGAVLFSGPVGANMWAVVTEGASSVPGAYALCYNPTGTVTGGTDVKASGAAGAVARVAAAAKAAG